MPYHAINQFEFPDGLFRNFGQYDPELAWDEFVKALDKDPGNLMALIGLSDFSIDLGERLSYLKIAEASAPQSPEVKRKIVEFVVGELSPLLKTERREEAFFHLIETVRFFPECEPAWFCLAFLAQNDFDRRGCLEQILRVNPSNRAAIEWLETLNSPLEIGEVDLPHSDSRGPLPPDTEILTQNNLGDGSSPTSLENSFMANVKESLTLVMEIEGTVGAALADWKSGLCLGTIGGTPTYNLEIAAAGNTEVVRAKMKAMANLGIKEAIEDILITLDHQFHLIRIIKNSPNLFFYVAIKKDTGNLALARHKLSQIEASLTV